MPTNRWEHYIRQWILKPGFALFTAAIIVAWAIVAGKVAAYLLALPPDAPLLRWVGESGADDLLKAAWYATPLTAAYIAALIGYHKFGLFREGKPHLTIDLSASSRPVSAEHNHIGVIARIHNTSKVAVPVFNVEWELAVVAPYSVVGVAEMEMEFFNSAAADKEFPWHWLSKYVVSKHGMVVEPNEVDQLTFDFIAPTSIAATVISLYVENVLGDNSTDKLGWYRRLFYDINPA